MTIALDTVPRTLVDHCLFTEDPRWHAGRLYFSDTLSGRVLAVDAGGALDVVAQLDDQCSGLGFMPDGDLLIVSAGRRQLVLQGASGLRLHADLATLAPQGINDMVVDPHGRAYVGELCFDAAQPLAPVPGKLFLVQPDGAVEVAADDMLMSNGSAIVDDGRTLLVAETMGSRITAFAIDAASGRLRDRRVWAQLPQGYFPDGIAFDAGGGVWAACPYEHGVVRVEEGGRITHTLELPADRAAFACMLGGPQRRTLFLCTAARAGHDVLRELKSARIEAIEVGFAGAGIQ